MESDNGAVREGVLVPVLPGSKNFENSIRPPLQNSYMYKESKQSFRYNSAFLINNATLQERYEAFRTKRRDMGYTEEEMEESYGFLLFDDENKANRVGETGVVPGHSTCTTLGDPSKGVYVSKYSDCLDLNRWYHGKSGYIAIIRLTKGRVREVTENYTVNYTSPSNGFDCHVSEQLSSVSANTSSFLAFERTQYYMYELPVGGAVQPPSHVCPFAIVAFSYWDTKTPASEEKEKSEEEKTVFHYYPWRGQLQISSQIYHVGLKSSTGPLIPAKLPTMMSVDGAIQMSDLRQKLPKAIFETCFSGEVSLEGMGCSLYELSPSEAEDTSLSQLTQGLKEKDLALTIQLNDNGFLILLHSSHFFTYEDTGSSKPEVLQGMFVFPDSRAIHRATKVCWKKPFLSPECLQVVPALNYAETEVEKCLPSPSGELRGLLEQHIQSYASLIHPGLTISPSREASIFPDQFDVPDALKYLYSAPKWTEMGWKRLKSYFHQPGSFELSVSRATELLVAGREERGDEPDDDVYYCLSSPEGSPMSPASLGGPEEQQSGGKSPGDTADTAADFSKALAVSMEDFEKPGKTMEDSNAPDKAVKEGNNLLSKEVQERLPSDISKPLIPAEDFAKPGLNKAQSKAPGTTLPPKEVQEELTSDLSQPSVSADDSEKPGKTKADCNAPGVRTEDEGTSLIPEEVEVDVQEKVHSDLLDPAVSAEVLGKADLAALGKADCNAPEVGVAKEETNLYLKEVQKDMPSGVSQPPVSAEVLRKPSPALATKPNSKAPEAGVEDNMKTLPQKEVQEEVPSDLSQLAVSAKAFGIASMRVMKKATEVTEVSTSPASGNLPTVLVITATERTATVLPHNESTTNNSSSLPCAKVQDKGGSALNGQRGKANQPSKPTEVSHSSISDWRKRPRKRHRFSGLCKRILRSTVADFEEKKKEDMESIDSSEVKPLQKEERMDVTQVHPLKMPRELMNLIQDPPLKKKGKIDVTQVHPLKMPRELMNLIQDPPLKKKEKMDVTQVHPLKMPRELINLIQDPPLKKKEKMDVTQVHPLKISRELMNLIQDPPLKMKSKDLIHYHPLRNKESMDLIHDDHPLKKKTERWDLKAIISECGRIFVPHGSEVIAKDIESLKVKGKVLDHKQCADEMMVEACIKVPQPIETGDGPNLELNKSDENKDLPIGMLDSKDSLHEVKMADVGKMASLNPSELLLNKDTDSPSSGKHKKKRQYVAISLSQLKTVLSRGGKRNKPINPAPEDQTSPVNKKSKADTPGMDEMENVNINKANPDRTTGAIEVSKEQTFGLDPKFALALGLTPTELNNDAHKSPEKSDIPLKKDIQSRLDLVPPQATSDQTSEALPSSPSTTVILASQRRPFKKKHEHADSIRKKWWLHYRSPAALERETVAISSQLVTLDPDLSRVVSRGRPCEGASAVSCPPAESLTLLADLARSTSNDKVLEQQSDPKALEKQDDHPSLVISDNSVKDGISPHDPDGSIVQVPISEGLQQHRKDIFADGTQTLRAFLCQQKDQNRKEPGLARESLSRGIGSRQKFHRFRQFIEKDGSVQVTRLWKENYNFNSDSKFTNDPKDKTVIRALHGPWDFDIKDTKEQVQLIIHMWIGLFYSRSTARFCQADSSLTCLEKKDSIEVAHGMVPAQVPPGTKTSSPAYIALSRIPEPDVLDLSKMGQKKAQPLSLEAEVLDLSMKTTSTVLDSLDTESKRRIDLKNHPSYLPATGLHKETISCPKQSTGVELKVYRDRVDSMMSEKSSDLDDDEDYETNNHENDSKGTKMVCLQNGVSPYERTLESDRSYILLCEQAASVHIHQEKLLETQTAQVLEGNNKKLLETQTAQVLEGNNKKLLETQTAQVLEGNNKKLLETQTAQVLEDNNKKLLETQTAQVLEGNNKKLLETQTAQVLEGNNKKLLETQTAQVLEGNNKKLLETQTAQVLEGNNKKLLETQTAQVLEGNNKKLLETQTAQVLEGNNKKLLETQTAQVLEGNNKKLLDTQTAQVLEGNNKKLLETQTAQVLEGNNKKLLETQTAQVLEGNNKKLLETQTAQVLEGNNKKLLQKEEEMTGDGETNAMCLKTMGSKDVNKEQQLKDNDSVKTIPCIEVQMDGDAANMADTVERNANEARDGAHVVICDGSESKEEMHKVDHNVKDSVKAAKPEAVHAGKDTTNKKITKAQTAVHVGKDFIDNDKALKAVHSENVLRDYGNTKDQVQTAMQDGNDTRDETLPAVICGEDSGDETPPVVCDGNTSVAETLPETSHTENDSQKATLAVVCDGNTSVAETLPETSHTENDSQKATLAVVCDGNTSVAETLPETSHTENDSQKATLAVVCDGNTSVAETLPETSHTENYSQKATLAVVCDGNTSVAETLPETSHTENDSQKATLAVVHGGNDLRDTTLPVKCNGKLYIDVEPTVVHDINGSTDEELPMGQGGDVSAGTSRVLPEMHGEIKCKDVLPTQVFPVCDGNIPFVGEFDTLIQPNNVLGVAKHEINEADVQTKEHEKELMQGQSKSDDVTTQSSTTFPPGSQHSQDETLERLTGQVEIPLIPREDIAHTDVLHSIGLASEMAQGQVEIPFIGVEIPFIGVEKNSQDINHTEVHDSPPSQKETLITVCDSANVLSGELLAKIFSKGTESVSRCPTVDEVLYDYIPIPDVCSASLAICDADGVSKPLSTGEGYSRCPTPTEDEPPFVPGLSYDHHTPNTVLLPNAKDTNSPNLDSGLALIENEKDHHEPSLSLYKVRAATGLHNLHKSSNNNKPNHLEAIDNRFSQVLADPRKNPIATSTPLNTPASSLKERSDYDPYSNTRLAAVEPGLHAHSNRHSLHSFSYSFPNTHCSLTEKAAFSVPSIHPEVLSNETTLTGNFSEIALERETCLHPALSELILQSTRLSIPVGSGPTAASQNLSVHSFTQPQPNSQKPAMIVNVSKSEDSRGQYNWEEEQTDIDSMSSDVLKSKQTDTPVRSNTNAHPYNTQYATEMRQIAVLQDYEDVMADEDVMGENEAPSVDKDNIESSLETNWISDDKHLRSKFRLNKTRLDFINSLRQSQEWEQREFDGVLDFNKQGTSSSVTIQSEESDKLLSHMEENQQEWLKYCRAKRSGSPMDMTKEEDSSVAKPRLVTVLDHKGNRITYENYPVLKPTASMHTRTDPDSNRQGLSSFLEFSKRWDDTHNADESDLTQSSMDLETLIFSERMNQMLKRKSSSSSRYIRSKHRRSNVEERASTSSPAVTVHFSSLQEDQDGSEEHWEAIPSLAGQKIRVEMPERMAMPEETDGEPQHLKKLSCTKGSEMTQVSDLVVDSFRVYHAMMTEVCAGKKYPSRTERLKREDAKRNSSPKSRAPSKDKDFCGQMKEDMYDSLHDNLNSVVRQSCKNKFRFYILVTSSDPFFRETKELLEAEGHIAVEQSQFCLGKDSPLCPLHIILRNEDIAEHICEVPHLLELKKSQNVLFAGIDRPDDIVNLTHQELFSKGGFVVFEGAALHTLSLSNMKKMSGFLEGLSKKGKWKWLLHYRDSRKLKENARSSAEAQGKKIFMDICQEAGMVEVLPYHECDVISRERPNYLHCLVRLQVQNVSARLPVFITDTTADKAFAKHGIFTMNINSFLLISQSDTCTIS
ncbi:uncharacterized protein LOC115133927 isoform X3 [Oncorhynchus nerka]|uniref:uncharacterized protein LOC115133927 isoform X3 n=1 Tax=Oncorhynchus nerka TaxID=8023 RepID=UPI0031B8AA64